MLKPGSTQFSKVLVTLKKITSLCWIKQYILIGSCPSVHRSQLFPRLLPKESRAGPGRASYRPPSTVSWLRLGPVLLLEWGTSLPLPLTGSQERDSLMGLCAIQVSENVKDWLHGSRARGKLAAFGAGLSSAFFGDAPRGLHTSQGSQRAQSCFQDGAARLAWPSLTPPCF